jgi:hypothetical protein
VLILLQFAFQLGGAIRLRISQTLFLERLTSVVKAELLVELLETTFGEAALNLATSATPAAETDALRTAYQSAFHGVFVFLIMASGLAFLASFGFEHKHIKPAERGRNKLNNGGGNQDV